MFVPGLLPLKKNRQYIIYQIVGSRAVMMGLPYTNKRKAERVMRVLRRKAKGTMYTHRIWQVDVTRLDL